MTWKHKKQLLVLADYYLHGHLIFFLCKRSIPDACLQIRKNLNKEKTNTPSISVAKLLTMISIV